MLTDVEIPAERLLDEQAPLSKQDLAACRASLGALQWLAVQTQPLLCGRCNILLSEFIKKNDTMAHAMEIQKMIGEVRQSPSDLKFFKLKKAKTWRDASSPLQTRHT